MNNTISLCLIAKNEESRLPKLLDSLEIGKVGSPIDEVIVVDTGSNDKTKEIAKNYGDIVKVYDFKWIDNFAAARNYSFSKGTKSWLFWLDCDDILKEDQLQKLKNIKNTLLNDENIKIISMIYDYGFDSSGEPTLSFERNRLVRNGIGCKWVGCIHEYVDTVGYAAYKSDIRVSHTRVHSNGTRNLDIFKAMITKGEILNDRDNYYYGKELYYNGLNDEAESVLLSVLDRYNWFEEKLQAIIALADIYKMRKDWLSERNICYRSFEYDIPRSEFLYRIGDSYFNENKYKLALYWYNLAATTPIPKDAGYLNKEYYTWLPHLQMCLCYYKLGNSEKAEEHNLIAHKYHPTHPSIISNIKFFNKLKNKQL